MESGLEFYPSILIGFVCLRLRSVGGSFRSVALGLEGLKRQRNEIWRGACQSLTYPGKHARVVRRRSSGFSDQDSARSCGTCVRGSPTKVNTEGGNGLLVLLGLVLFLKA